jgi:hypothetical protein
VNGFTLLSAERPLVVMFEGSVCPPDGLAQTQSRLRNLTSGQAVNAHFRSAESGPSGHPEILEKRLFHQHIIQIDFALYET